MARFDVYANPGRHAHTTPYLLDALCIGPDSIDAAAHHIEALRSVITDSVFPFLDQYDTVPETE